MNELDVLLRIPWARIPFEGQQVSGEIVGSWAQSLLVPGCREVDGKVVFDGHIKPSGSMTYVVNGGISASVRYECVRCLELSLMHLEGDFSHTFRHRGKVKPGEDEDEVWDGVSELKGDYLDLEPVLAEEFALLVPPHPSCQDASTPRTCSFQEAPAEDFEKPAVDSRWEGLQKLALKDKP